MSEDLPVVIGVSLKMYFGAQETLAWCRSVADITSRHPAVTTGLAELFILPGAPVIPQTLEVFADTPVKVGAQNLFWEDRGAFTGEVSGAMLRELGCRYVEVGHAERRRLFGEDDVVVAAKTAAALRNRLTPVLCIGEPDQTSVAEASARCIAEVGAALKVAARDDCLGPIVAAYEPQWAIGASQPATPEHIGGVCRALVRWLAANNALGGSRVIYGGSAGPGLLPRLGDAVGGLFLGRFAHDPRAFEAILDDVVAVRRHSVQP
jgi:triosephosphate isomerase